MFLIIDNNIISQKSLYKGVVFSFICVCFYFQNIELKVEVETLKKELKEKQELLKKAS